MRVTLSTLLPLINNSTTKLVNRSHSSSSSGLCYKQGQYSQQDPSVREYFYYVDHNGMLFLDDSKMKNFTSCFKEKKFLQFFFNRIKRTTPSTSPNIRTLFPFTSHCGKEQNYIRTDDNITPFVFTSLSKPDDDQMHFEYNNTGVKVPVRPSSFYVGSNGRVYHELERFKHVVAFGLVKSSIVDEEVGRRFLYEEGGECLSSAPTGYRVCKDVVVQLDYGLRDVVEGGIGGSC